MKCDRCGYSDNGSGDWAHACGPVAIQQAPVANKQIRLLAELADKAIRETDLREVNGGIHITPAFEKFAELIIRECMACSIWVGKNNTNTVEPIHTAHAINQRIKKHFGVEE